MFAAPDTAVVVRDKICSARCFRLWVRDGLAPVSPLGSFREPFVILLGLNPGPGDEHALLLALLVEAGPLALPRQLVVAPRDGRRDRHPLAGEPLLRPHPSVLGIASELPLERVLVLGLMLAQRVALPTPQPRGLPDGGVHLGVQDVVGPALVLIGEVAVLVGGVAGARQALKQAHWPVPSWVDT